MRRIIVLLALAAFMSVAYALPAFAAEGQNECQALAAKAKGQAKALKAAGGNTTEEDTTALKVLVEQSLETLIAAQQANCDPAEFRHLFTEVAEVVNRLFIEDEFLQAWIEEAVRIYFPALSE